MLADLSIKEFLNKTAAGTPIPGGGSVAALNAAIAAGLCEMVADLTARKKGFEAVAAEMKSIAKKAASLRTQFVEDIDRDADAYNEVIAAFRLPKTTEDESGHRKIMIQQSLQQAARVPLQVAATALDLLDLIAQVIEKGIPSAISDVAVAALAAKTAVLGALYNVKLNLASIKDQNLIAEMSARVNRIESQAAAKAKAIFAAVKL